MFPTLLYMKLATATMAAWMGAASPLPMPSPAIALAMEVEASAPVEVHLYDANMQTETVVLISRDGTSDPATTKTIKEAFHARSGAVKEFSTKTLAIVVDLAEKYGKPIEFVSAYRSGPNDGPHLAARALDFRIQGVDLREVRDYIWAKYSEIGLGWYPYEKFLHIDSRPNIPDCAWTFMGGTEHYHPAWEVTARQAVKRERIRPGS